MFNSVLDKFINFLGDIIIGNNKRKFGLLLIALSLIFLSLTNMIIPLIRGYDISTEEFISLLLENLGGIMLLYMYMLPSNETLGSKNEEEKTDYWKRVRDLAETTSNETHANENSLNVHDILASLNDKIHEKLDDHLRAEKSEISKKDLIRQIENIRNRLLEQTQTLVQRSNVNLVIGVLTTMAAVIILYITIKDSIVISSVSQSLMYFAPRISIVILTEAFSFFFLRLYRSNYNDIKYYQNELTNVEFKTMVLSVAIGNEDKLTINKILLDLLKTERNFIIRKGESTIELEFMKHQVHYEQSLAESFKTLADSLKGTVSPNGKKARKPVREKSE